MEAWPTQGEIITARILGHEPRAGKCACGFRTKSGSVPSKVQVANHIWTVIHNAKEAQARRIGEELCQPCKGSGRDPFGFGDCPTCGGIGTSSNLPREQYEVIARDRNHRPASPVECVCGVTFETWGRHARSVAASVLQELEEFEASLREGGR